VRPARRPHVVEVVEEGTKGGSMAFQITAHAGAGDDP
jgi:hypothetical protein